MSTQQLITDVARELQDEGFVRWSRRDLADYANQTLYDVVRNRPDLTAETVTLCLTNGTRQRIPADAIQLLQLIRNADGRAVRFVHKENMDALAPSWHARSPSKTVRDYTWREDEPDVFYVYPPATDEARVEAVVSKRPSQIAEPVTDVDWSDEAVEASTYRDGEQLLVALARDLMIGLDWSTRAFIEGLFDFEGRHHIREPYRCPTRKSWDYLRETMETMFPDKSLSVVFALMDNLERVFTDKDSYMVDKPVEPADLDATPDANPDAFTTIMDEALDGTVIDDMWADLLDNGNAECDTDVDWESGDLETLAKRDALGLISAVAHDIATGTTRYTRGFVENLWDDEGSPVWQDADYLCGFKHSWDFIVSAYEPLLDGPTHQAFTDLVGLVKTTVDDPQPALVKVDAPDIAASITADRALGQLIFDNRNRLLDRMWSRIMRDSEGDCPNPWPPLPVPLHWRDTVMDGMIARALARNTDAASIERAGYHWEKFNTALGIQRQSRASFRPGRRGQPPKRDDDD